MRFKNAVVIGTLLAYLFSPFSAFAKSAKGDIVEDCVIDLKDVVVAMQVVSGITPGVSIERANEVNGDGRIGLEEAIHNMGVVAGEWEDPFELNLTGMVKEPYTKEGVGGGLVRAIRYNGGNGWVCCQTETDVDGGFSIDVPGLDGSGDKYVLEINVPGYYIYRNYGVDSDIDLGDVTMIERAIYQLQKWDGTDEDVDFLDFYYVITSGIGINNRWRDEDIPIEVYYGEGINEYHRNLSANAMNDWAVSSNLYEEGKHNSPLFKQVNQEPERGVVITYDVGVESVEYVLIDSGYDEKGFYHLKGEMRINPDYAGEDLSRLLKAHFGRSLILSRGPGNLWDVLMGGSREDISPIEGKVVEYNYGLLERGTEVWWDYYGD